MMPLQHSMETFKMVLWKRTTCYSLWSLWTSLVRTWTWLADGFLFPPSPPAPSVFWQRDIFLSCYQDQHNCNLTQLGSRVFTSSNLDGHVSASSCRYQAICARRTGRWDGGRRSGGEWWATFCTKSSSILVNQALNALCRCVSRWSVIWNRAIYDLYF